MTEAHEGDEAISKRGLAGPVALAAPTLLLVILLAVPGFLAGTLSRMNKTCFWTGDKWYYSPGFSGATARVALYPATKLMEHSASVRRFYLWQYEVTGGEWLYND